jgi:hypothetical protein
VKNKNCRNSIFTNNINISIPLKEPKTKRLYIRVSEDKKKELKRAANRCGLTISELIMNRIENLPVKDYQKENEFLMKLNELTQALGYIGNNINQATVAIHQIKISNRLDGGEIGEFNKLMHQYLERRNELSENLQKLFFS